MTNGLRPLAELCMDGCFADFVAVLHSNLNGRLSNYVII